MWMGRANWTSSRGEERTRNLWCRLAIPALGFLFSKRTRSLMRSLPRSLTALAWDFGSAAPSWNRMAAACGLPIILHAAQAFTSPFPPKLRLTTDTHSRSHRISAGIIRLIPRHNCAVVGGRIGYNYGYSGG